MDGFEEQRAKIAEQPGRTFLPNVGVGIVEKDDILMQERTPGGRRSGGQHDRQPRPMPTLAARPRTQEKARQVNHLAGFVVRRSGPICVSK